MTPQEEQALFDATRASARPPVALPAPGVRPQGMPTIPPMQNPGDQRLQGNPLFVDVGRPAVQLMGDQDKSAGAYGPPRDPNYVPPSAAAPAPGIQATNMPAASETQFTPYESKNPTSTYDDDLELTHLLSRSFGMAGRGEKAMHMRDAHMAMQLARTGEIGQQAQRAFVAGDVTKAIDMFNHVVPNGAKIKGYARDPKTGDLQFQMADGTVEKKTSAQFADSLAAYQKPEIFGDLLKQRGKAMADTQREAYIANLKGSINMNQALAKGMIDRETGQQLEMLKSKLKGDSIHLDMAGNPWIAQPGGGIVTMKQEKSKVTGKMEWVPDQVIPQTVLGGPVTPGASSGTRVDAASMARTLGLIAQ